MIFNNWKKVRLGDLGEIVGGGTPHTKNSAFYSGDISWITPKDLSVHKERYISRGDRMITQLGLKNSSAKLMPKNSVLFSSRAPIGYVALTGNELCTNQGFKSIIPKAELLDPMFLLYLLKHKKKDIELVASGTIFMEITGMDLKNFVVTVPPLIEQKFITSILSCLDDKIELNIRMSNNLEKTVDMIYKNWFVHFKPFKGDRFENSEIGRIPKGWILGKMSDFFNVSIGKTPPRKELTMFTTSKKGIKWASIADLGNYGTYINNTAECLTKEAITKHKIKIVPIDTVMLSFKLTVGRVAISNQDMTTNEAIAHFKIKDKKINEYLYFYLKNFNFDTLGSTSSIATAVNSKIIKAMPMLMPTKKVLNSFHDTVSKLMLRIKKNQQENVALIATRDALLLKLMTGKIRMPAEKNKQNTDKITSKNLLDV